MKTLTRKTIVLVALSMLATVFAQAQTSQPAAPVPPTVPAPAPAPAPTPVQAVSQQLDSLINSISFSSQAGSGNTVLVIPSEQTTTEGLLTINEDMNVMIRIFEKNLDQDRIATASSGIFIPSRRDPYGIFLGGSRNQIQSMYLQGFGVLFLMNVDFPLSPPADVQEEQQESQKTEEGDPVWEQIRQEMYEPQKVDRRGRTDPPEERYDAEKVESLQKTLINTLKHAANVRCLKPDESVILAITGKGGSTSTIITAARLSGNDKILVQEKSPDGKSVTRLITGSSLDDIGLSSPSVLVIRAKKSDIDIFAKGDVDFEKFRQRVQLLTYPLLGGAEGGNRNFFGDYYGARSTGSSNRRR